MSKAKRPLVDPITELLLNGAPAALPVSSTKQEFIDDSLRMRAIMRDMRAMLIGTVVAQIRAGMNDGVTADQLRDLADDLERDQQLNQHHARRQHVGH